jgi:hypothetical protein
MRATFRTVAVATLVGTCLFAATASGKKPPPPPPDINTPEGAAKIAETGIVMPVTKLMPKASEFTGGALPKPIAVVDFKVNYVYKFDNVPVPADYYQRITDALYTVFVKRTAEAGFEVLPKEKVTSAAIYAELAGSEEAKIRDVNHADTYAPTGMLRMPFSVANIARLFALEAEVGAQAKVSVNVDIGVCDMGKYGDGGLEGCVKISNCAVTPTVKIETGYETREMKLRDNELQYIAIPGYIGWCNGADLTADYSMFGVPTLDIAAVPELAGFDVSKPEYKLALQAVSAWDALNRVGWGAFKTRWAETGGKK